MNITLPRSNDIIYSLNPQQWAPSQNTDFLNTVGGYLPLNLPPSAPFVTDSVTQNVMANYQTQPNHITPKNDVFDQLQEYMYENEKMSILTKDLQKIHSVSRGELKKQQAIIDKLTKMNGELTKQNANIKAVGNKQQSKLTPKIIADIDRSIKDTAFTKLGIDASQLNSINMFQEKVTNANGINSKEILEWYIWSCLKNIYYCYDEANLLSSEAFSKLVFNGIIKIKACDRAYVAMVVYQSKNEHQYMFVNTSKLNIGPPRLMIEKLAHDDPIIPKLRLNNNHTDTRNIFKSSPFFYGTTQNQNEIELFTQCAWEFWATMKFSAVASTDIEHEEAQKDIDENNKSWFSSIATATKSMASAAISGMQSMGRAVSETTAAVQDGMASKYNYLRTYNSWRNTSSDAVLKVYVVKLDTSNLGANLTHSSKVYAMDWSTKKLVSMSDTTSNVLIMQS